ncbi:MAG: hypothetical protein LBS04_02075 [Tannerellaceae bacterium]|jgi:hypothetical protein|nr:hypothetical protein [Tannerellaceae bacterium]
MGTRGYLSVMPAIKQQDDSLTAIFMYPPYTVTAVVKDPPPNTNLSFDAIIFYALQPGETAVRRGRGYYCCSAHCSTS